MVSGREALANAVALNSSMVNGARLVGPALAGILLAETSEGVCFLCNGLSYLAVIAALLAMSVPPRERPVHHAPIVEGLREGFRYAFGFPPIRAILLLLGLVSLTGMSYAVLMPVFATDILKGDARTLGWLNTSAGMGALAGALFLANRESVLGLGRWIALAPALLGVGLLLFSFSEALWLSMALLLVTGFGMMVQMAASNTVLQTIVEEDKRGRVMSFYTMAFMGCAPLGSLLAGALAERLGAPNMVRIAGVCTLAGSAYFAMYLPRLRQLVRPLYVRMGILPEVAAGIGTESELAVPPERVS
jgi:MFS family permease